MTSDHWSFSVFSIGAVSLRRDRSRVGTVEGDLLHPNILGIAVSWSQKCGVSWLSETRKYLGTSTAKHMSKTSKTA